MNALLSAAGRAFLRAFVASIVVLAPGILAAPDLNRMRLLGVAAILASFAAGIRALQSYVPELTFQNYLGSPIGVWVDSFARAFLASLIVTLPGVLGAPDLSTGRSLAVAAIIGAFSAGFRALQGLLTAGEHPAPSIGLMAPEMPESYTHVGKNQAA